MSVATRVAIRSTQILTLALLIVALAGGARLARAGQPDPECETLLVWAEESLDLWDETEPLFDEVEVAMDDEDPETLEETIDGLGDAAEAQDEIEFPSDLEDNNDAIVGAYEDAADATEDLAEAIEDEDEEAIEEALDAVADAQDVLAGSMALVEGLAEECGESPNNGGETETVEVEVVASVFDAETGDPLEGAFMVVLEAGVSVDDFDFDAFLDGDDEGILSSAESDEDGDVTVEVEVEIGEEYTVVIFHPAYEHFTYGEDQVLAVDEDAGIADFGEIELSEEFED